MAKPTRLDYCQYLLSSPINYTLTHFADHSEDFSHDMINRYLAGDSIPPRLVWENVKPHRDQVKRFRVQVTRLQCLELLISM